MVAIFIDFGTLFYMNKLNVLRMKAYRLMLGSSLISLGASLVLAVDAIKLAKNASASLSCNINAVVSCGKVALSWQSNLLGFPNAFLGLICEPVIITIAIVGMMGVILPKKFLTLAMIGYGVGLCFAIWLFSQSYFVIGAFCPWCLLVTTSTVTVFSSILRVNIIENNIGNEKIQTKLKDLVLLGRDKLLIVLVFTILAMMILIKYHNYILP